MEKEENHVLERERGSLSLAMRNYVS